MAWIRCKSVDPRTVYCDLNVIIDLPCCTYGNGYNSWWHLVRIRWFDWLL